MKVFERYFTQEIRPTLTSTESDGSQRRFFDSTRGFHEAIFGKINENSSRFHFLWNRFSYSKKLHARQVALFDQHPRDLAREKENSGRFVFATQLFEVGTENTDRGMGH